MDHPAARSSASSEAKGVRASTLLVGGFLDFLALLFCGLLFFAVRARLIFAFSLFGHVIAPDFISGKTRYGIIPSEIHTVCEAVKIIQSKIL